MALQNTKHWLTLMLACGTIALTACEPVAGVEEDTGGGGGGGGGGGTAVSLSLGSSTLVSGTRTTATATVSAGGSVVSGVEVCFDADSLAAVVSATCVTTNSSGVATAQIEAGATSGSASVTATASGASGTASYTVNGPRLSLSAGALLIAPGSDATTTATVVDGNGDPIEGAVVTFTLGNSEFATMTPASGSVLTNASGQASLVLSAGTKTGASTVTAAAAVPVLSTTTSQVIGTATLSAQSNFQSSGSISTGSLSLSNIVLGAASLSAYGTTSLSVTVRDSDGALYTTPTTVRFTSTCAQQGKAKIGADVTTVNGTATATYTDEGCGQSDTIQASLVGLNVVPVVTNLTVQAPTVGSIQFLDASPANISIKGTGGAGRQETSTVRFRVVDEANRGKVTSVTFALSTTVGGITLSRSTATSNENGEVSTIVQAGTVSTPVRVTATVTGEDGKPLTTQSDQLTISTGLPDQAHFSVSADKLAIEGLAYDGEKASVTVRLADHFGNPVPQGTAVSFRAEGGSIQPNCTVDANGACSVVFTSQAPRPADGRVTILAYAIGEETFTDADGDGFATTEAERVDLKGNPTDMGELFLDVDADGVRDAASPVETFIDFDTDGVYDGPDGKLNSTLCKGTICSTSPTLYVGSQNPGDTPFEIVFADSWAAMKNFTVDGAPAGFIDLEGCVGGVAGATRSLSFDIGSRNSEFLSIFNAMPSGTTVTVTTDNGKIQGPNTFTLNGSTVATRLSVRLTTDASVSSSCNDNTKSGTLVVTVKTPKGNDTAFYIPVIN